MRATSAARRQFGFSLGALLALLLVAVGCSQSGTTRSVDALTTPSPLSAGATSTAAQPGPSYDATGSWFGEYALWKNGPVVGEGYLDLVQDADGNLRGTGNPPAEDCHSYAFTRVGDGAPRIRYRVVISPISPSPQCQGKLSGLAELDTTAHTIKGHLTGNTDDGSSRLNVSVMLSRQ